MEYSFCETSVAMPGGVWHIRPLTDRGRRLGGGADTMSLCNKIVSWDIDVPITEWHLQKNGCTECRNKYRAAREGS